MPTPSVFRSLGAISTALLVASAAYAGYVVLDGGKTRALQVAATPPPKAQAKQVGSTASAAKEAGFSIKEPRASGWSFANGTVTKYPTAQGKILVKVDLTFKAGNAFMFLTIFQPPVPPEARGESNPAPVQARGTDAILFRLPPQNPDHLALTWDEAGLTYYASTSIATLSQDDFLKVVESIN